MDENHNVFFKNFLNCSRNNDNASSQNSQNRAQFSSSPQIPQNSPNVPFPYPPIFPNFQNSGNFSVGSSNATTPSFFMPGADYWSALASQYGMPPTYISPPSQPGVMPSMSPGGPVSMHLAPTKSRKHHLLSKRLSFQHTPHK